MDRLKIPVILGTGRHSRMSEYSAKYVHSVVALNDTIESKYIDACDYLPAYTQADVSIEPSWSQIAESSDGFIIVAPEYNHSFPGELKLFLDQAFKEYHYKPVGVIGVSSGVLGGARMVEQLRTVAIALRMIPINNSVYISNVKELFQENGLPITDTYTQAIKGMLSELLWLAKAMAYAKNNFEK